MSDRHLPVVALISGNGSNLQAIIDARDHGRLEIDLRAVISNRADAWGLERAAAAGVAGRVLDHREFADRESYDAALLELIHEFDPELVILAGFMRILSAGFVRAWHGRMLNIHPSLLPRHQGLRTHQRALDAGDSVHGATVHFVTEELDGGPAILQVRVPVLPDDDADALAARVLVQEHRIFPRVISWIAEGRLRLGGGGGVFLDGGELAEPVVWTDRVPGPV